VKNRPILKIIFGICSVLKKFDTENYRKLQTCPAHLHTVAALPCEVQKVIFVQD